ncbi:MAG TPA: hypothetical protein ENK52_01715 [Saprospiraceae bacterium]|nr:hypothetical protein [Saprospiraceae bacterium]
MKRLLYTLLFLSAMSLQAQQELSLHFMKDVAQSNLTNPAIFNKYKINVSLPSPYFNFYHSAFSANDIFRKEGTTLVLKTNDLVKLLENDGNLLQTNFSVETFSLGIQIKKLQVSFSHAAKFNGYFNYPKGIVDLLWNGNASSIDKAIDIAPKLDLMAYQEFGLGIAYQLNNMLTFGGKIKYLNGLGVVHTERSNATIFTDAEYYQLTAETDFLLQSAGVPLDVNSANGDFISFGEFNPEFFSANKGIALDLGATFNIGEMISVSASILDVGQINWKDDAKNFTSRGSFSYEGLDLKPLLQGDSLSLGNILDSVEQVFMFEESPKEFSTSLPTKFYLSGTFKIKSLQLGALFYGEAYQQKLYPAFALSARKEFGKIFSLGAVYSIRNKSFNNLGLNMALKLGPIQLFALSDNLFPLFNPLNAQNANFRFGLNVAVGKKKKNRL